VNRLAGKSVKVLDCTIRDGSYLIDYQFTVEDAYLITSALCQAGIEYIEVGHGLGLDAQQRGKGFAAESDYAYIEASVAATQHRSKIGVFFIPGIGDIESIRQAADVGLDFVRVGTNVNEYTQAREAVEVAKHLGLKVWSNLMKSYIVPPDEFARICREVERYGVDVIAMVDSAGGMTPDSVRQYVSAAKSVINCDLGFHGHNNLQLAIANCLAAIEGGCSFIDSSLRGMGRSAGNASTEILCALLAREKVNIGKVDYKYLIGIAQELVTPIMPRDIGPSSVEIASGISYFHSSFQEVVEQSSSKYGVLPFETILQIGPEAKSGINKKVAGKAAAETFKARKDIIQLPDYNTRWVNRHSCRNIDELMTMLKVLSAKTGYKTVLSISRSRIDNPSPVRITPIRIGCGYCIGHVESASKTEDLKILKKTIGHIKNWMLDLQISMPKTVPDSINVVSYDDDLLILTSLTDFIRLNINGNRVYIPTSGDDIIRRAKEFMQHFVTFCDKNADIGIALTNNPKFSSSDVEAIKSKGTLNLKLYRLDLGDAIISEVTRVFNTLDRMRNHAGSLTVNGETIVSGGKIGQKGDIIVDSINTPSLILGKANGIGGSNPLEPSDEPRRKKILQWILSAYHRNPQTIQNTVLSTSTEKKSAN
jgi:4-hydroxy-2-oxovalerate aldolase